MTESDSTSSAVTNLPRLSVPAIGLCVLTAALWGGTAVAIQFSIDEIPPIYAAGLRFVLAAMFMLAWCLVMKQPRDEPSVGETPRQAWWQKAALERGQWVHAWWAGVLLFLQIGLFHLGIARSSASHATVLINTYVLWVAAAEHFVLGTMQLTRGRLLGLSLAAIGGLIILLANTEPPATGATSTSVAAQDQSTLLGDLLLVASALVLAVKVLHTKYAVQFAPPLPLMFWHDVVGAALLLLWSVCLEEISWLIPAWQTVVAILYQGVIVGGFCFGMQAYLLRKYGASQIAIFSVATPLFGITFAHIFRGDELSAWLAVSATSVVAGIIIVNRAR